MTNDKIGQCEAYIEHKHGLVTRCKGSGRTFPLDDDPDVCYVLCYVHADADDLILPEEKLR